MTFRAGAWIVVKSREEILSSVDKNGELGSLPMMAEMLQYCGQKLQVSAVAHKACDTINKTGGRRVANAVHLKGIRCDGSAHGDCQAGCLIFWKTDWLRPADGESDNDRRIVSTAHAMKDENELRAIGVQTEAGEKVYSCQATRLFAASVPLPWWDIRQYMTDVRCGNVGIRRLLRVSLLRGLFHLRRLGIGWTAWIALHDAVHRLITGRPSPYNKDGLIPIGDPTPIEKLHLAKGDLVEVKSHEEIRRTLTEQNFNRGMRFDVEMVPFCGRTFKVDRNVERLIDERTGKMLIMKSPCIVLDGVVCGAEYSDRRLFCPREIPPYFREIWLRRVAADGRSSTDVEPRRAQ